MLWKILSIVAAIALALGIWFSYSIQGAIKAERDLAQRSEQNLQSVQTQFAKATEAKERNIKSLEDTTKQRDEMKERVAKQTQDTELKIKEAEAVTNQLAEVKKQVAQLEEEINKRGNLKKLLEDVNVLTKELETSNATLANKQQQLATADSRIAAVRDQAREVRQREDEQRRGVVTNDFTARVSQAFPGFGFVILNKGNRAGLFANASLEVRRGSDTVAKLKVRDVEQGVAIADVIPGSMTQENAVRAGDLVVAGRAQTAPSAIQSAPGSAPAEGTPAADGSTPAAPANMADDPFGGQAPAPTEGAAPAMQQGQGDPFGEPAPAAPAPAEGEMQQPAPAPAAPTEADPFGNPATPAPATPAPATADPFGASTPAPAAPAEGNAMMGQ